MREYITFIIGQMSKIELFTIGGMSTVVVETVKIITIATIPLLIIGMTISIVGTGMQTRFLFSMEPLKPKFDKFNPINGFKRIFSIRSGVELIKNMVKLAVIAIILYKFIIERITAMAEMLFLGLEQGAAYTLDAVVDMVYAVCIIFVFVASLDYLYQRWEYERKLKMSKQEIKEEFKQMEGDPQIKGKIKQKQRQMATSRMMQAVPTADVVIRNPTHFAVALKYDPETDNAPVVVAKGQDALALRIVAVAEAAGVYVIEDRPLARAIYATAEVKMEIPYAYYTAIAEIFALVYSVKNNKKLKNN